MFQCVTLLHAWNIRILYVTCIRIRTYVYITLLEAPLLTHMLLKLWIICAIKTLHQFPEHFPFSNLLYYFKLIDLQVRYGMKQFWTT